MAGITDSPWFDGFEGKLHRVNGVEIFARTGGKPGAPGVLRINGAATDPKRQYVLRRGDTVSMATPGGGGHGDPRARDGAAVAADLAAGYVSDPAPYRG